MSLTPAIYSQPVQDLIRPKSAQGRVFDITNVAPGKIRFVNIDAFLDHEIVQIDELQDATKLSDQAYAAISHVWRGLPAESQDPEGIMVRGLNREDPINVDVFKQLCLAGRKEGVSHFWLDKLCIIQDRDSDQGKKDQPWQLPYMFHLYKNCRVCLVAPGGLNRLPLLSNSTPYLDRLWTLQEALAPNSVKCLVKWAKGNAVLQTNAPMALEALASGQTAMVDLFDLLVICIKGGGDLYLEGTSDAGPFEPVYIFGKANDEPGTGVLDPVWALLGCKAHADSFTDAEVEATSLWRAMLLRTASYPQDIIFGSMGMFGVDVPQVDGADPSKKYDSRQLARLLVDFVRRITARGYAAQWLGTAPEGPPAAGMTLLPALPLPQPSGAAVFHGPNATQISPIESWNTGASAFNWWIRDSLKPSGIRNNGDFSFNTLACYIVQSQTKRDLSSFVSQADNPNQLARLHDGQVFELEQGRTGSAMAAVIGNREWYTTGAFPMAVTTDMVLLMLLSNDNGIWRNIGYAWGDTEIANTWSKHEFVAGGAPPDLGGIDISAVI